MQKREWWIWGGGGSFLPFQPLPFAVTSGSSLVVSFRPPSPGKISRTKLDALTACVGICLPRHPAPALWTGMRSLAIFVSSFRTGCDLLVEGEQTFLAHHQQAVADWGGQEGLLPLLGGGPPARERAWLRVGMGVEVMEGGQGDRGQERAGLS